MAWDRMEELERGVRVACIVRVQLYYSYAEKGKRDANEIDPVSRRS
jgi:hypothetical protein